MTALASRNPDEAVMWRERVNRADFESEHFTSQLIEPLRWAVGDAWTVERAIDDPALSTEIDHPAAHRRAAA